MGAKSRVTEFFSSKPALSLSQLVALRKLLNIPTELLIAAPSDRSKAAKSRLRNGAGKPPTTGKESLDAKKNEA